MPQCFKLPPYPGFKYLPEFNEARIIQCRTLICLKLYETTMTSSEIMHRLVFLPLIPGKPIPSNAIPVSIPSGKYFEESITPTDVSIPWPYNVNKKQYEFIHRFYPGSFLARHLPLPSCSGRTAGCIWQQFGSYVPWGSNIASRDCEAGCKGRCAQVRQASHLYSFNTDKDLLKYRGAALLPAIRTETVPRSRLFECWSVAASLS